MAGACANAGEARDVPSRARRGLRPINMVHPRLYVWRRTILQKRPLSLKREGTRLQQFVISPRNPPKDQSKVNATLAEHLVLLEPVDRHLPAVLGRLLAVARPVVGMEAVRRTGIDLELG